MIFKLSLLVSCFIVAQACIGKEDTPPDYESLPDYPPGSEYPEDWDAEGYDEQPACDGVNCGIQTPPPDHPDDFYDNVGEGETLGARQIHIYIDDLDNAGSSSSGGGGGNFEYGGGSGGSSRYGGAEPTGPALGGLGLGAPGPLGGSFGGLQPSFGGSQQSPSVGQAQSGSGGGQSVILPGGTELNIVTINGRRTAFKQGAGPGQRAVVPAVRSYGHAARSLTPPAVAGYRYLYVPKHVVNRG